MQVSSGPGERFEVDPASSRRSWSAVFFEVLAAVGVVGLLSCLFLPAVRTARPAAYRNVCTNNLKQIALALQNYEEVYGVLPPAHTTDSDGQPLHSWRTLILPWLEEQQIFQSIDLTKPWNDPANAHALSAEVYVYRCPAAGEQENRTTYLAVVTPVSCLRATEPRKVADITDGTRNTLMIVEVGAEHSVPWMSPVDADEALVLGLGPDSKLNHAGGMGAAFVDGHVSFLSEKTPASQRLALISVAGNDNAAIEVPASP